MELVPYNAVTMYLRTLGGLALEGSDIHRPKPLLLLAFLALEGPKTRRELADLFWMGARDARDSLSTALRHLRYESATLIDLDGDRVATSLHCDVVEVMRLLDAGKPEDALDSYRGVFLQGLDLKLNAELEEWVYCTREAISARVRDAYLRVAEVNASKGEFDRAGREAERAYNLPGAPEPDPETLQRLHALLLAGGSSQAEKVKQEAESFGIAIALDRESARKQFSQETIGKWCLPTQSTSFVGRGPELLELAKLLAEPQCRLVTLHGAGGVGKSRLAVQAACNQGKGDHFKDGVYFIALDALTHPAQIPLSIAATLDLTLQSQGDPLEQVKEKLGQKRLLLILDNYEQLMEAATLPADLIHACPNLKLVVTSRERLNLQEEYVLSLEGLPFPDGEVGIDEGQFVDAVQLFVQRAKKSRLDFQLTTENLPHVLKICHLVQGYPLGIELAAAWVKMLPPHEIAANIEADLDFLVASFRNATERHQSIRAAFAHSWALLKPKEREVLRKLSVFRGGFRREAARAVAEASLPVLASLVDKSLLRVASNGRFDLHALLVHFTQEKLLEAPEEHKESQARHAAFFLTLAEEAEPKLLGPEQRACLDRLEEELDNLRATQEWAEARGEAELGLRLAGALWRFWSMRGYVHEGRERLKRALSQPTPTERTTARAKSLTGAGALAYIQGDYAAARVSYEESLTEYRELGDNQGIAYCLNNLGLVAHQGDHVRAQAFYSESLSIRRQLRDKRGIASSLNSLGILAQQQGDHSTARTFYEESLAIWRELHDKAGLSYTLINLGLMAQQQGNYAESCSLLEESLTTNRALGDKWGIAASLYNLGHVAQQHLDCALARARYEESLTLSRELGDKRGIAWCLGGLALLAQQQGDFVTATSLLEECRTIWRGLGDKRGYAATLYSLGRQAQQQGDYAAAGSLLGKSLTIRWELGDKRGIAESLEAFAALSAAKGDLERAVRFWGAAEVLREAIDAPLPPSDRPRYELDVEAVSTQLGPAIFKSRWDVGRAAALESTIASALGERAKSLVSAPADKEVSAPLD